MRKQSVVAPWWGRDAGLRELDRAAGRRYAALRALDCGGGGRGGISARGWG
ncbi:hypothetical protein HZF08_17545 [Paenibacillus sp. CGMCC 1.16610]|uniref:Uncharacterized protein n=1 Tax=Paenibacillus anseongense TaxID=2682845 RepID=A0ABW9UJF3_9BACL|nr:MULTISPECIES: hypothetical protein [Paenibacillus]MBA2940121.1 hypothetical protein [Paenibacillus sp. CGMCC 1.16610]MVQ38575.1 hypothetical protein [Paenibacillus anseongense]